MNVEYTGRQFEVIPAIRKQVETGLEKLQKILGDNFDSHVILSVEKHRHIAEITVTVRNHDPIVGLAQSSDMGSAVTAAQARIDRQAVKYKTRKISKKRLARKKHEKESAREEPAAPAAVGKTNGTAAAVASEAHIVKSADSVSRIPLTLEEAVKEAQFRDREVFVFCDLEGRVNVLHRKSDGKMELIEAP